MQELSSAAGLLAKSYDGLEDKTDIVSFAKDDLRITLIDPNGQVLCDSDTDADALENHADRPEFVQALESGIGSSERRSDTLSVNLYYYALRLPDGRVLRVGLERDNLFHLFGQAYPYAVLSMCALLILSVVFALILTKKLLRPIRRLTEDIDGLSPEPEGEYKELTPLVREIRAQRLHITRQMRTIEEEKNKLSAILRDMAEGLILLDGDRRVLLVNDSARRLLETKEGVSPSDADSAASPAGERASQPADQIGWNRPVEGENLLYLSRNPELVECVNAAARGESRSVTARLGERWVRILTNPVEGIESKNSVVCLLLDVTETTRAERIETGIYRKRFA